MGRAGSGAEFHVNFGSGWVTSFVGRLGRVKKNGPTSNSASNAGDIKKSQFSINLSLYLGNVTRQLQWHTDSF